MCMVPHLTCHFLLVQPIVRRCYQSQVIYARGNWPHMVHVGLMTPNKLCFPAVISILRYGLIHIHYLSLNKWFSFILRRYPKLLFGGFDLHSDAGKCKLLLESFWQNYRKSCPDHTVFSQHSGLGMGKKLVSCSCTDLYWTSLTTFFLCQAKSVLNHKRWTSCRLHKKSHFSEPTFHPPGATKHCFATSLP